MDFRSESDVHCFNKGCFASSMRFPYEILFAKGELNSKPYCWLSIRQAQVYVYCIRIRIRIRIDTSTYSSSAPFLAKPIHNISWFNIRFNNVWAYKIKWLTHTLTWIVYMYMYKLKATTIFSVHKSWCYFRTKQVLSLLPTTKTTRTIMKTTKKRKTFFICLSCPVFFVFARLCIRLSHKLWQIVQSNIGWIWI